ncbi:MAG TPA: 6-phosphogluconolactonase [Rhizomicrobium sp.]|nr:6-phosphogluconolactonase [Rhizomicrobium sp.]
MSTPAGRLEISDDPHALARHAADWFVNTVSRSTGTIRVSLSGGSTPKEMYTLLDGQEFRSQISWRRLELFWGDERFVPHDDPASNYRMTMETLLARAPVSAGQIHPVPVQGTPAACAAQYESVLKQSYGAGRLDPSRPLFDIMLLGLGADGHTASLIPGQTVLEERTRWVAAVAEGRPETRITLTYPAIESSAKIAFLVTGAEKANAVRLARAGDPSVPAGRIRTDAEVIWFVDRAALGSG